MGNRRGKHDIAPTIRMAFLRALHMDDDKRELTLSQLMAKAIEEQGILAVLDRVAKFTVQQREVAVTKTLEEELLGLAEIDDNPEQDSGVASQPKQIRH